MEAKGSVRGAQCRPSTTSRDISRAAACDRVLRSRRADSNGGICRRLHGYLGRPQKRLFTPEIKLQLKEWLVRRRRYPYPTREEKRRLAQDTGLDYNQICNWFANWRRKLKNAECDGGDSGADSDCEEAEGIRGGTLGASSWGRRILLYNHVAARNAEKIPVGSNDSLLEDNDEMNFSDTSATAGDSRDSVDTVVNPTAMDHCYSLVPPDKNGNYKHATHEMTSPRSDVQQYRKWLMSVEHYVPHKQAAPPRPARQLASWATPTSLAKGSQGESSREPSKPRSSSPPRRSLARDEIDAVEALATLARTSRAS